MSNQLDNTNVTTESWLSEMSLFIKLADQTSEKIRTDGVEKSYLVFSQFIDTCLALVTSLSSIKETANLNLSTSDSNWNVLETNLWTIFSEILNATTIKDSSKIADLIEFDLSPIFEEWKLLIKNV